MSPIRETNRSWENRKWSPKTKRLDVQIQCSMKLSQPTRTIRNVHREQWGEHACWYWGSTSCHCCIIIIMVHLTCITGVFTSSCLTQNKENASLGSIMPVMQTMVHLINLCQVKYVTTLASWQLHVYGFSLDLHVMRNHRQLLGIHSLCLVWCG